MRFSRHCVAEKRVLIAFQAGVVRVPAAAATPLRTAPSSVAG